MEQLESQTPNPNLTFNERPKKTPLGAVLKIIIGIIIVLVLGGGICLATRIWDPLWNPFRPEPEEVIEKSLEKMKNLKQVSFRLNGNVKVGSSLDGRVNGINDQNNFFLKANFNIEGSGDKKDPKNQKGSARYTFSLSDPEITILNKGAVRVIEDSVYLKFEKFDLPPELKFDFMLSGIDVDKLIGQWMKMEAEEGLSASQQLEYYQEVQEIFAKRKIFSIKEELKDEKINERKCYHYLVAINNEELVEALGEAIELLMKEAKNELSMREGENEPGAPPDFAMDLAKGIIKGILEEFLNKMGEINLDLWIDKKALFIQKLSLGKEIDLSEFSSEEAGKLKFSFDIDYFDFNKPVEIREPESYVNFEDLITPIIPFETGQSPLVPIEPDQYYEY